MWDAITYPFQTSMVKNLYQENIHETLSPHFVSVSMCRILERQTTTVLNSLFTSHISLFLNKSWSYFLEKNHWVIKRYLICIMWEHVSCFLSGHIWPFDFNPQLAGGWRSCMGRPGRSALDYHKHTSIGKSCSQLANKHHYYRYRTSQLAVMKFKIWTTYTN